MFEMEKMLANTIFFFMANFKIFTIVIPLERKNAN